jgi:hypothetical protein
LQQLAWNEGAGARLLAEKIKVVQNDGAPNPRGLATEIHRYLLKQGLDNPKVALSVSFVGEEVYEGGRRKNLQPSLYQKTVTGQTLQSSVATTTLQSETLHLLGRPFRDPWATSSLPDLETKAAMPVLASGCGNLKPRPGFSPSRQGPRWFRCLQMTGSQTIESSEFGNFHAVHFVVCGILQDDVSSSNIIDRAWKESGRILAC